MLRYFIQKVHQRRYGVKPRVIVAVPSGITEVEKRAVKDSAEHAGARHPVYLIEEPMAAAIGVGLPVQEPAGNMIVDIGGGTTEVAIMSLADLATSDSIRTAGDDMDEAIVNHLKRTYNLLIGEPRAEKIKIQIGSAAPLKEELTMEIAGRDTISGLPRKIVITSEEIREALREPIAAIIEAVTGTLERAEPELAADLIDNGIHICGGGSLLRGMDRVLSNATGLTVHQVEDPLSCVARGTAVYLENLESWKDTMEHGERGGWE
jgi:rod shape-determining protein MreB